MQVDISGTTNKNLRIEVFEDSNATVASSTYTLSVSRRDLSGKNVDLKGFELSNVELTTVFNTREINYYAYVPESMSTVELKVSAAADGAEISGAGTIDFTSRQTKTTIVTVTNGNSVQRYSLTLMDKPKTKLINQIEVENATYDFATTENAGNAIIARSAESAKITVGQAGDGKDYFINGKKIKSGEAVTVKINTDRDRFDIRAVSGDKVSEEVYVLYLDKDKDKPFEPYISKIMLNNDGSTITSNDLIPNFDKKKFEYAATNGGEKVYMFAEPDTENSFIELYNEENGVYSIVEDLGSMIEQNIDKVKGYSVFKFRITKFSANGYENINEYNVKVYNTDSPIANRIWVQDAVMEPEFKETLRDYAVKISNNTTEFTVNSEIGYSDGYVEMNISPFVPCRSFVI